MRQFVTTIFIFTLVLRVTTLPGTLAARRNRARVHPISPSEPLKLPEVMEWPFNIDTEYHSRYSDLLQPHLRRTYNLPLARIETSRRLPSDSPIALHELEEQIRKHAKKKNFVWLGGEPELSHHRLLAFAIDGTYQDVGQKYFAILSFHPQADLMRPLLTVHAFVKASGVSGIEAKMQNLRANPLAVEPGQALTSYDVLSLFRRL
ncbi:uncharacterized protein UTRI_06246_B [Ustilago trichophora]|uniref:Effector family protein Eff1 n=1 Tax=Ustilago trichophora TaxID=86804 RepID=A0A5C3EGY7_9BASI|nr:uncharacterized protein UTRI_06246_B [Ustilago trichophora]